MSAKKRTTASNGQPSSATTGTKVATATATPPTRTMTPSPRQEQEEEEEEEKGAQIVFWLFMLFIASVTMTVGNKYVMKQWNYANSLTLLQMTFTVVYLIIGNRWFPQTMPMKPITMAQYKIFAISSLFLAVQMISSLKALPYVAIATVVTFRNTCIVVIAVLDYLFLHTTFSLSQIIALSLTTLGMILYASQDINFNMIGYLWLFVNSCATIFNTFWNKVFITKYIQELKIQTSYGISFIQQTETIPLLLGVALLGTGTTNTNDDDDTPTDNMVQAIHDFIQLSHFMKTMVFVTCFGGILICIAYPKCFSLMTGTSVTVASTANKAFSALLGIYFFQTQYSHYQIVGLVICFMGGLWYALLESNKKTTTTTTTTTTTNSQETEKKSK